MGCVLGPGAIVRGVEVTFGVCIYLRWVGGFLALIEVEG